MFRLIRLLLDPRPLPISSLPETIRDDATQPLADGQPQLDWNEAWARSESASAALAASLSRVTQARLAFEAAIAESDEAVRVEEAAYNAMLAAKASSNTVH